jgi:hypothetical protein
MIFLITENLDRIKIIVNKEEKYQPDVFHECDQNASFAIFVSGNGKVRSLFLPLASVLWVKHNLQNLQHPFKW